MGSETQSSFPPSSSKTGTQASKSVKFKSFIGKVSTAFSSSSKKSDTGSEALTDEQKIQADKSLDMTAKSRQPQDLAQTQRRISQDASSAIEPAMKPSSAYTAQASRGSVDSNDSMAITSAPKKPDWP
jgi:hypothetical protein